MDPDDIEMLEDLIVAATNEALRKVEDENAAMMQQFDRWPWWVVLRTDFVLGQSYAYGLWGMEVSYGCV